jgi:hypothetical protein
MPSKTFVENFVVNFLEFFLFDKVGDNGLIVRELATRS